MTTVIDPGIWSGIGNTPLVELRKITPSNGARVMLKLEFANPTGSMKDRMGRAAIEAAEAKGELIPGGVVVEYTGGTTGVSLAFACAAKGYALKIVYSDAFSDEKRQMMRAFGASVEDVVSDNKRITADLIRAMIARSRELSEEPEHWWCNQLENEDIIAGYHGLGEEIWTQTDGSVDAYVQSVGTAHSLHGAARMLRNHNKSIQIIAVEPSESAVLSGGATGAHKIEGMGIGFIPPLWHPDEVDGIEGVSTEESMAMARRLAKEEGVFAGTSTGTNVAAALRVAERLGPGATVVTLAIDSGLRYLSTPLYRT